MDILQGKDERLTPAILEKLGYTPPALTANDFCPHCNEPVYAPWGGDVMINIYTGQMHRCKDHPFQCPCPMCWHADHLVIQYPAWEGIDTSRFTKQPHDIIQQKPRPQNKTKRGGTF